MSAFCSASTGRASPPGSPDNSDGIPASEIRVHGAPGGTTEVSTYSSDGQWDTQLSIAPRQGGSFSFRFQNGTAVVNLFPEREKMPTEPADDGPDSETGFDIPLDHFYDEQSYPGGLDAVLSAIEGEDGEGLAALYGGIDSLLCTRDAEEMDFSVSSLYQDK